MLVRIAVLLEDAHALVIGVARYQRVSALHVTEDAASLLEWMKPRPARRSACVKAVPGAPCDGE